MPNIPLPKDPRHQRFADLVLGGMAAAEAHRKAGFKGSTPQSRATSACRMLKNVHIVAYMAAVRQESALDTVLSVLEKREFLARIVRTPLMAIDPHDPQRKDGDLIRKYKRTENEESSHEEIEKLCPLKALAEDNKLSGDDPEANAAAALAEAFAQIAAKATTLPSDRM
jgi:phage terminase small subunit